VQGIGGKISVRLLVGAAVAAVAVLALLGTASAHKPRIQSKVTIHTFYDTQSSEFVYYGRVRSDERACRRHRTVLLVNEQGSGAVGADLTNRRGHWEIRQGSDGLSGDYYARVKRKVTNRFICKGARSRSVPAPSP
jgi:hypothetical protein